MASVSNAELVEMLIRHEGLRLKPYKDSVGKLTIGIGRNLDDVGITQEEAEYLAENDLGRLRQQFDSAIPWWRSLDHTRQLVLLNMGFNLGCAGLLKFQKMLAAVQRGDYQTAAAEMLDSTWAAQVHRRALELASMMQTPEKV